MVTPNGPHGLSAMTAFRPGAYRSDSPVGFEPARADVINQSNIVRHEEDAMEERYSFCFNTDGA